MSHADRDGASWRTRSRRREADIAFLAKLRKAVEEGNSAPIEEEARNLAAAKRKAPMWRVTAVLRAYGKLFAKAVEVAASERWVCGEDDEGNGQ